MEVQREPDTASCLIVMPNYTWQVRLCEATRHTHEGVLCMKPKLRVNDYTTWRHRENSRLHQTNLSYVAEIWKSDNYKLKHLKKCKVAPVHAMKAWWGSRDRAPLIPNLALDGGECIGAGTCRRSVGQPSVLDSALHGRRCRLRSRT